jgi:hypothetical protein
MAEVKSMVARINRGAIEAMIQGNNKEACSMLADALHILETNQCGAESPYEALFSPLACIVPQTSTPKPSRCCAAGFSSHQREVRRRLTVGLPVKDRQDNLTTAIYNRAFLLYKDGPQNSRLTAAVLLFNHALSCHLYSVSSGDSQALNQALFLYTHAYHIVLQENYILQHSIPALCLQDRSYTRLVVLLTAALCHNMAAVHGDFWNFSEARFLRCQLAQVIHWEGSRFSRMETDDFVFFHLGIFFAIIDDFRIAPAA